VARRAAARGPADRPVVIVTFPAPERPNEAFFVEAVPVASPELAFRVFGPIFQERADEWAYVALYNALLDYARSVGLGCLGGSVSYPQPRP
jgi:hypothetical protein